MDWPQEASSANRADAIFRVSSMTQPITAAAAMVLVEECRLRLDDPVDRLTSSETGASGC